jgi:hypothetical protein
MTKDYLHARLDKLSEGISKAEKQLRDQKSWSDGHNLTSGELEARYKFLKSELDGEVADMEAHGHQVSILEASFREWLNSLDLGTK